MAEAKDKPIKQLLDADGQASVTEAQFESLFKVLERTEQVQDGTVTVIRNFIRWNARVVTLKLDQLTISIGTSHTQRRIKTLKRSNGS